MVKSSSHFFDNDCSKNLGYGLNQIEEISYMVELQKTVLVRSDSATISMKRLRNPSSNMRTSMKPVLIWIFTCVIAWAAYGQSTELCQGAYYTEELGASKLAAVRESLKTISE